MVFSYQLERFVHSVNYYLKENLLLINYFNLLPLEYNAFLLSCFLPDPYVMFKKTLYRTRKARFSATSSIDKPPGKGLSNKTKYNNCIKLTEPFCTELVSLTSDIAIIVPVKPKGTYINIS